MLFNHWYFSTFQFEVITNLSLLTKVKFESVYWFILFGLCCDCLSVMWMYLDQYHIEKSFSYSKHSSPGFRQLTISLIFILNSVSDCILPWSISSSCFWKLESVDPRRTLKFLSDKKLFVKFGSLLLSPRLCRLFIIPHFYMAS